ncbi:MAG: zinc-ribbon domain-containing protein, partial [Desulfobacterales bacterium]
MIVICEECGKKYRIDPSKIKGAAARFKCRVCTHMIMVSKPQGAPAAASAVGLSAPETDVESTETGEASAGGEIKLDRSDGERIAVKPTRKSGLMNLRTKMLLLFFFL